MVSYIGIEDISEITSLAHRLRAHGEALGQAMTAALRVVESQENHPETFPSDEFTDAFLANYRQPVDLGESRQLPANEAVRTSAGSMGPAMADIAQFVAVAMASHSSNESDIASSFGSTPGR